MAEHSCEQKKLAAGLDNVTLIIVRGPPGNKIGLSAASPLSTRVSINVH